MKRALAACGLWLTASCFSERARPAPPVLGIVFDSTAVHAGSKLTGTVRAADADGLDSVWMQVDTARAGADALFETAREIPFEFVIPADVSPGNIPVRVEARDVVGFRSQLDTFATVLP